MASTTQYFLHISLIKAANVLFASSSPSFPIVASHTCTAYLWGTFLISTALKWFYEEHLPFIVKKKPPFLSK
jgi:hypothetical protein